MGRERDPAHRGPALLAVAALLAAVAALSGCAVRPGPADGDGVPAWPGHVEVEAGGRAPSAFESSYAAGLAAGHPLGDSDGDGEGDLTVLTISGGGAFGAFGAGVLVGWTESGRRPEFDLVSGVSAGALTGALAFAGPGYDPVLVDVAVRTKKRDVVRFRPFGLLGTSVGDSAPLRAKVREVVDDGFLDIVAAEHRKGRRLYVATVDLDRTRLRVWDMGLVAATPDPERERRFEDILIASAAVPVFFPPVYIPTVDGGRAMHVDGGVLAPILFRQFMLDIVRQRKGRRFRIDVYAIVNDAIAQARTVRAVPPRVPAIGARSIDALAGSIMSRTLIQAYVRARRSGARFHVASIPLDLAEDASPLAFDAENMQALFDYGREAVVAGTLWQDEPPLIEDSERIP